MVLIIETGKAHPATTHEGRCARCRKIIHKGEMVSSAQVHYPPPRYDYRFASVHIPNCKPINEG